MTSFALGPGNSTGLDLSDNLLTGTLPPSWGSAGSAFRTLDLSGNFLGGTIPASWVPLFLGASSISLGSNQLNGSLPAGLAALPTALNRTAGGEGW